MIFYLDDHPTACASFYAVEHLRPTTQEAIQVLSDATRALAEECRILSIEKKMRDVNAEVQSERHFLALERNAPLPLRDINHPLVLWAVESQDAWDWLLELATDLTHEARSWLSKGPLQEHVDATGWFRVHAPRPVNAGRIVPRERLFPPPQRVEKVAKEFAPEELLTDVLPYAARRELTVRAYRRLYWTKYRHTVRYTKGRRPWWWASFDTALASGRSEK